MPRLELVSLSQRGRRLDSWVGRRASPFALGGPTRLTLSWSPFAVPWVHKLTAEWPMCLTLRSWWADVPHLGLVALSQTMKTASGQLGGPTCLAPRPWWADAPRLGLVPLCRSLGTTTDGLVGRRASPCALGRPTCLALGWWLFPKHGRRRVDNWVGRLCSFSR